MAWVINRKNIILGVNRSFKYTFEVFVLYLSVSDFQYFYFYSATSQRKILYFYSSAIIENLKE